MLSIECSVKLTTWRSNKPEPHYTLRLLSRICIKTKSHLVHLLGNSRGQAVAQLAEALRCKPEGHGFDSQWRHWLNPSGRTIVLGSTQSLTEKRTRNISWRIKAAGSWGWQLYHLHVSIALKSGSLKLLEPSGLVQACTRFVLPFNLSTNLYPSCS